MAEYINREQALSFPFANGHYDHKNANEHFIFGCETYKEWLETLPTADVVEVVRCKDCKFSYEDLSGRTCSYGICVDCVVHDNFFCAYGEGRREDDNK